MASKNASTLAMAITSGMIPMHGIMASSPEEDTGMAPPSGRIVPGGKIIPGREIGDKVKGGPTKIWPRKPSKDAIKRGRKPNNFAR